LDKTIQPIVVCLHTTPWRTLETLPNSWQALYLMPIVKITPWLSYQSRINNQEAFLNGFRYVYRLKEALHLDLATFEAISYNSTRNYSQNPVLSLHFVTVNLNSRMLIWLLQLPCFRHSNL
jgi:hypothetical protein